MSALSKLTPHVDPMAVSESAKEIKDQALSLADLPTVTLDSLAAWVRENPRRVPVLGLAVGLGQEKLKNSLRHHLGSSAWLSLAKSRPEELIRVLNEEYDLVRQIEEGRHRAFDFGDILVARGGARTTATRAGESGRKLEDEIEEIVRDLGLLYQTRTRFTGRGGRTAPCDIVIPGSIEAAIVVAAKGFDSTGSKLTDAVREIEEMAEIRLPQQYVLAVIDGIGWKSRASDLHKIYDLWKSRQIDGLFTLKTLVDFRSQVVTAAKLRGLLSNGRP